MYSSIIVLVVQSLSCVWLFATPWTAACQASLSFTISCSLLKLRSIELTIPSNRLVLCCPLLFLLSNFPRIRVFSNESVLPIRWWKYWRFSFNISHSNEYSRLILFRIDWFDCLAVQGTLKSLLQFKSINSSVLSLLYGPTLTCTLDYWKNHSVDCTDLCQQSNVCFLICSLGLSSSFVRLRAGGEGDHRGWDGWMASPTQRTWVWAGSRSWWWTGKPGVLQSMGSQRVRHHWATELN